MSELGRLTKIVQRTGRKQGVSVNVLANAEWFSVFSERHGGCKWVHRKTRDVYQHPASTARSIRRELKDTWSNAPH